MKGFTRCLATAFVVPFLVCCACSRESLSERDLAREQSRARADIKRAELTPVAGVYNGELTQSTGGAHVALLNLETKDVPTQVEGQIDPVLVPTLTGYLHLIVGAGANEYFNYSITRSEYDPSKKKLNFVASNAQFKDMFFSLENIDDAKIEGTWSAPDGGTSGTATFTKNSTAREVQSVQGEYSGFAVREAQGLYQVARLTLTTHYQPSEGLQLTAGLRMMFGDIGSKEFMAYEYPSVEFNPATGQLTLQSADGEAMATGILSNGRFIGHWSTTSAGKMGDFTFEKSATSPPPKNKKQMANVKGAYQGKLVTTNAAMDLPERLLINLVSSLDKSRIGNFRLSGGCRLYLGGFETLEFEELSFKDVQYNPFTRELVAKTDGQYKLTFQGSLEQNIFAGTVSADGIGKVATFEVEQQ